MRRSLKGREGLLCLALASCLGACDATIGAAGDSGPSAEGSEEGHGPGAEYESPTNAAGVLIAGDKAACDLGTNVGFGGLRRVTRVEYNRLIHDLFGVEENTAGRFGQDGLLGNFSVNAEFPVSELQVEQYFEGAENVSQLALANKTEWLTCEPALDGEESCARKTIAHLGRRAFRRPLEVEEVERYWGVFSAAREGAQFDDGLRVLIEAFLASPSFLYHLEFGLPKPVREDVLPLSPYELASRLSFFFWRSAPDEELLTAAEAGDLASAEGLQMQAERLANHEKAYETAGIFHKEWLRLLEPASGDEHEVAIRSANADTMQTVGSVIFEDGGSLADLFTVDYGFLDEGLKELYEVTGEPLVVGSDGRGKYQLDAAQRGGLLARAAFLNANSPPTGRGKFIREEVLCGHIPPPPPGVDTTLGEPDPNEHPMQQWLVHVEDPGCGNCHRLMDPFGFAFEHYDDEGRFREEIVVGDKTWPVLDEGEIIKTTDIDGPFDGGQELQSLLSESVDTRACFAFQWVRFATGREPGKEDACSLAVVNEMFEKSEFNIRELMLAVTQVDAFRFRRVRGASR